MVSRDPYSLSRTDFIDRVVESVRLNESLAQFFISFSGKQFLPQIEDIVNKLDCFDHYSLLAEEIIGGYLLHCSRGDAWNIKTTLQLELDLIGGLKYKVDAYTCITKEK